MSKQTWSVSLGLVFFALAPIGCAAEALEDEPLEQRSDELINNGGGDSRVGKACKVSGGSNAGHSGTYTNDVDGLNCAGSWGSTACTGSDGKDNGKCKSAARVVLSPISVPIGAPLSP